MESKEVFKKPNDEVWQKDTGENRKISQWPKWKLENEQTKNPGKNPIILDYNPKYNIDIHKPLLIEINAWWDQ